MGKIKHIAIASQDPDKTAKFYTEVFGLKEIAKINSRGATGYHLSDGDLNLAILKFKNDQVAGSENGMEYSGLHHIGFEVESSGFFDPARVELRPREILIDLIFSAWQDGDSIRIVPVFAPQVAIDLRSTPAPRTGHIGVAILGSEEIDVREVDLASLRFGPGEATLASADSKPQWLRAKLSDVNRDGETDLDVSFSAADAELPSDAEEACLRGRVGGLAFLACAPLEGWRGR